MIKIEKGFSFDQKVSSQLAFIFILILSFVVAWFTVSTGQEIVDNAKTSATFNNNKKIINSMPASGPVRPN
jgi:hypothetical protein